MKRFLIFSLALLFSASCTTKQLPPSQLSKPVVRGKENNPVFASAGEKSYPYELRKRKKIRQKRSSLRQKPPIHRSTPGHHGFLLPSIIHPRDQSIMVLVQQGEYLIGERMEPKGSISPKGPTSRWEPFPDFYIDRYEITVEQFKRFDPDYDETPYTGGKQCPKCPAMGIDWKSAWQYCTWAGKRLPTEGEWIAGARGSTQQPWPWGSTLGPDRANLSGGQDGFLMAAPVGSFPRGSAVTGAQDMIGNVWEWVSTPYLDKKKDLYGEKPKTLRILKGGGWTTNERQATITFRNIAPENMKNPAFGFRCVKPG